MQTAQAIQPAPVSDAVIQMVRALARRQARIDARKLEAANDNIRLQ